MYDVTSNDTGLPVKPGDLLRAAGAFVRLVRVSSDCQNVVVASVSDRHEFSLNAASAGLRIINRDAAVKAMLDEANGRLRALSDQSAQWEAWIDHLRQIPGQEGGK